MIFTAIGIVFLLTLGFLVITWVAWFIFLWLSKLWYETSPTNFNRTSVRDLFINSFAVFVYGLPILYNRLNNSISKMIAWVLKHKLSILAFLVVILMMLISYAHGYGNGYKACSVNYGISK